MSIYYEKQRGGLCRLHTINAFFGRHEITDAKFIEYQKLYDKEMKKKFNINFSCSSYDTVNSDQNTIISYILHDYGFYTKFYALNELFGKKIDITQIVSGNFIFIYNPTHIWGLKYHNNKWNTVDSLKGISPFNINSIPNLKNVGFIVPVNLKDEFYYNLLIIKKIFNINLNKSAEKKKNAIDNFFRKMIDKKCIMGDVGLEIPLSIAIDTLQVNLRKKNSNDFQLIENIVRHYNAFLQKVSRGKYNDLNLLLTLTPIIYRLIHLTQM